MNREYKDNVEVLYRNDQWIIGRDEGGYFFGESRSADPGEVVIGSDIPVDDLLTPEGIEHVCGKGWVNIDLFEAAYLAAVSQNIIPMDQDAEVRFARAKLRKLGQNVEMPYYARLQSMIKETAAKMEMPR